MSLSRRKMSFTPSKEPFRRLLGVVSDRGHSPARAQPSKSRRHWSSKQLLEDERKLAADEMARLQAELAHAHSRIEALQQSLAMAVEAASPRRDHSPAHSSVSSSSPPTSPRLSLAKDGSSNGPTAATSAWDQLEADLLRLQKGSPAMPISSAAGSDSAADPLPPRTPPTAAPMAADTMQDYDADRAPERNEERDMEDYDPGRPPEPPPRKLRSPAVSRLTPQASRSARGAAASLPSKEKNDDDDGSGEEVKGSQPKSKEVSRSGQEVKAASASAAAVAAAVEATAAKIAARVVARVVALSAPVPARPHSPNLGANRWSQVRWIVQSVERTTSLGGRSLGADVAFEAPNEAFRVADSASDAPPIVLMRKQAPSSSQPIFEATSLKDEASASVGAVASHAAPPAPPPRAPKAHQPVVRSQNAALQPVEKTCRAEADFASRQRSTPPHETTLGVGDTAGVSPQPQPQPQRGVHQMEGLAMRAWQEMGDDAFDLSYSPSITGQRSGQTLAFSLRRTAAKAGVAGNEASEPLVIKCPCASCGFLNMATMGVDERRVVGEASPVQSSPGSHTPPRYAMELERASPMDSPQHQVMEKLVTCASCQARLQVRFVKRDLQLQ